MMYGSADSESQTEIVMSQLAQELYNTNLLMMLITNLHRIDFEASIYLYPSNFYSYNSKASTGESIASRIPTQLFIPNFSIVQQS